MIDRDALLDDALSRALPLYRVLLDRLASLDDAQLATLRPLAYEAAADLALIARLAAPPAGPAEQHDPLLGSLEAISLSLLLLAAAADAPSARGLPLVDHPQLAALLGHSPQLLARLEQGDDEARRLIADALAGVGRPD